MALTDATLDSMATHLGTLCTHMSLHSASPGTDGSNEIASGGYARQAITWGTAANGDISITGTESFSGPASGACTHVGLWSASTGGTFRGGFALTGDQTFNAAGQYTVTALTVAGSST